MKFRDLFNTIKENKLVIEKDYSLSGQILFVSNDGKQKLKELLKLPFNSEYVEELNDFLFNNDLTRYGQKGRTEEIYEYIKEIENKITLFYNTFISLYPELNETSVSIKLPDNNDLSKIGEVFEKLDKIFGQILNYPEIEGKVEVINFDHGSLWIDICLKTLAATTVVACITYSAGYILKEKRKLELLEIEYKNAQLHSEHLSSLQEANKKLLKVYVEKEVRIIKEKCYSTSKEDTELDNRLIFAIKEISKLIDEGAQIHPALEVSNEIKHEFPDLRYIENIVSKQNVIENK